MVTVYIVTLNTDYEGSDIASIFNSLEDAKNWIKSVYKLPDSEFAGYDGYSIYKKTVGDEPTWCAPAVSMWMPDFSSGGWRNRPWKWFDKS